MPGDSDDIAGGSPAPGSTEPMLRECFAKKGEFVSRNIAGETILVPVRGRMGDLDSIFNLNEVACFIWNRIDGHTSLRQLVSAVCSEFEIGPEAAEADTREFVATLLDAGLIAPTRQA
jgi:hypothetical protein